MVARSIQTSEEAVPSDDILGVSRRRFRVHVKQVIRGSDTRNIVVAEGISHGRPREDIDFLMVLRRRGDGTYAKVTAAIWDAPRPELAEPCS